MLILQEMDPPCAGAILRRACPGFPLRRHLPPYAVGFLSAAFLRAERAQANAQPSGGEKRARHVLPAWPRRVGAWPPPAHGGSLRH